jgi:hypothetical protein
VANETTGSNAGIQIPQTQGFIPGCRQRKLTIRGDGNVLYKVVVAFQSTLGDGIVGIVAGDVPNDNGLIARGGQQQIRGFWSSCLLLL